MNLTVTRDQDGLGVRNQALGGERACLGLEAGECTTQWHVALVFPEQEAQTPQIEPGELDKRFANLSVRYLYAHGAVRSGSNLVDRSSRAADQNLRLHQPFYGGLAGILVRKLSQLQIRDFQIDVRCRNFLGRIEPQMGVGPAPKDLGQQR